MKYSVQEISIKSLIDLIKSDKIDLNPSYQRNFIWSSNDQSDLIDTILNGYPLPNLFIYEDRKGIFEMVDGQQRSKTIMRFYNGDISSTKKNGKKFFKDLIDPDKFLSYRIPVVKISELQKDEFLKDFYVLINKKGKTLNTPELYKSEFHDTNLMRLANDIIMDQKLIDLNLFTDASKSRMNDRLFVEELILLSKYGISEKKDELENLYTGDITIDEYEELKKSIDQVFTIIYTLNNNIAPIRNSRYKQKNDFYTLFGFIKDNIDQSIELFEYQYRILLLLNGVDENKRQLIRPTNDECKLLKNYALSCVTQSNSKNARLQRLNFFNLILKNKSDDDPDILDLMNYLNNTFPDKEIEFRDIFEYKLIDVDKFYS